MNSTLLILAPFSKSLICSWVAAVRKSLTFVGFFTKYIVSKGQLRMR
jgi:hypothetical protein